MHVLLDGWAARYKILPNGSRQIVGLLIPGDVCDLQITVLGEMDHSIVALTTARIGYVSRSLIKDLHLKRSNLGTSLWRYTMVGEAILRSWVVNLGQRDAAERIAHLLCEVRDRLKLVGLVRGRRFALPLTQEVMADALGLTSAHVNRVLQRLRARGFIILYNGEVTILDDAGLGALAGFDPAYLD